MERSAVLYRMVMPEHLCPSGLKAKDLLEREGFIVEDQHLKTRQETDRFKSKHSVATTPQIWIGETHIGGYTDLRDYLGKSHASSSYLPVIAIFSMALMMAFATSYLLYDSLIPRSIFELFIAISVCLLAVQKLQDVEKFSTMFLSYDLLAQRWVQYGKVYPFAEAAGGLLMLSGALPLVAAPLMLFIGGIGAVSVFKAVYVDKRDLKCACVGGDSNVPLGFVSLTENLMMLGMGFWMLFNFIQITG